MPTLKESNTIEENLEDKFDMVLVGLEGEEGDDKNENEKDEDASADKLEIQTRSRSEFTLSSPRFDGEGSPRSSSPGKRLYDDHYSRLLRKRSSLKEVLPISFWSEFQEKLKNEYNLIKLGKGFL